MVILTSQYEQQVGTLYFEFSQFILSSSLLLLKSGRRRNQHMILMVLFRFLSWSESFRNQIMTILSKHGALESCPLDSVNALPAVGNLEIKSCDISCFSNFALSIFLLPMQLLHFRFLIVVLFYLCNLFDIQFF